MTIKPEFLAWCKMVLEQIGILSCYIMVALILLCVCAFVHMALKMKREDEGK